MYIHILYTYVYIIFMVDIQIHQKKKDIPTKLGVCRTAFFANHPQPNGNHEPEMLAMLLAPLAEACHLCISQSPRRHPHLHEGNVKCLPPGTCSARMEPAAALILKPYEKTVLTHTSEVSLMSLLRCFACVNCGQCQRCIAQVTPKTSLEFLVSGIQSLCPISQFQGYNQSNNLMIEV